MAKKVLIFGGAGFIGCNAALYFASQGLDICIADNLFRAGARSNLPALKSHAGGNRIHFEYCDIRDRAAVEAVVKGAAPDLILHECAQVAVTTSVTDPRLDFEVNALGTFNLLEATRAHAPEAFFIYASTNKVYGGLEDRKIVELPTRYAFASADSAVREDTPLDFHSPYACSKGCADQYVHDYSRIFGLRTCVFRQSCIYGPYQYGVEDQGWVAWFTIAAAVGKQVTVYGSGKQVRDVLHVADLVAGYETAWQKNAAGEVFNVGGGPEMVMSLIELLAMLRERFPKWAQHKRADTRPGDQPVFISDIGKIRARIGWEPKITPAAGVEKLTQWVSENLDAIRRSFA